jgi:hypothetical protein
MGIPTLNGNSNWIQWEFQLDSMGIPIGFNGNSNWSKWEF